MTFLTFLLFSPGALWGAGVWAGPFTFLAGLGGSYGTPPLSVANFSFAESSSACSVDTTCDAFPVQAQGKASRVGVSVFDEHTTPPDELLS